MQQPPYLFDRKFAISYQIKPSEGCALARMKIIKEYSGIIMKQSLMEQAEELLRELSEMTGILLDSISKEDPTVLSLFQIGTDVNRSTGLDMIPMFDNNFARRILSAVQPVSYEDVRKIRAFLNEGGDWAFTTMDMLENGIITLNAVLADQTDLKEFARENGISDEDLAAMIKDRHVIDRQTAEHFADITWKLAFFKIQCEELYYIHYKKRMTDFY